MIARPDPVVIIRRMRELKWFTHALFAIAIVVRSPLAMAATQLPRTGPKCPQLGKIVNAQPIRPGQSPAITTYASGEKKVFVSVEMALTPLEFKTVTGFKMQVPAAVLRDLNRCDEKGHFTRMEFDFVWIDGKLVAPIESATPWVHAYGHFSQASAAEQRKSLIERERKSFGKPEALPQIGLTAYSSVGAKRPSKAWDAFVLNNVRDNFGNEITFSCPVAESDLRNGPTKFQYADSCRSTMAIREGFGANVYIDVHLLQHAETVTKELIRILNSYIVGE